MKALFKPTLALVTAIKSRRIRIAVSAFTVLGITTIQPAEAATLDIFNPTVSGTSVYGPYGELGNAPTLIAQENLLPSDTLNMTVSGIVGLDNTVGYNTNAAGVIVSPDTTNTGNHPGQSLIMSGNIDYGALVIGNDSLGFYQVFAANAANGAGNSNAPTTLSLSAPLSSIFTSSTFQGIAAGTALEFRVADINTDGNSGSLTTNFSITSNRIPVTSTPPTVPPVVQPPAPQPPVVQPPAPQPLVVQPPAPQTPAAQSVPEPDSTLGLIALAAVGIVTLTRHQQQKFFHVRK